MDPSEPLTNRSARSLRWPDLVWSHFSRPRFGAFDDRVAAAAAAGFSGIGLYVDEYGRLREEEGRSDADIRAVLDGHGIVLADAEVVSGWWSLDGVERDRCARVEALAYRMADAFGVRYLQAIGSYHCSLPQAIDGFGALCDRAARHGLLVGIEWLPFTNIATADDARSIVAATGRSNAGYCADIWHHTRGANDLGMLRTLQADRVFAIQMNDGALDRVAPEEYKADCLANRVPPGDGEFDCVGFLRTLREIGVDAPISLEVCSTTLWGASAAEAADAAASGMRRVLSELEEE